MDSDLLKPVPTRTYTLLEALKLLAPVLQKIFPIDTMVGVTDLEKFIAYAPGKDVAIPGDIVGMSIPEADAIYLALQSKQLVAMEVPEEAFGFSFKATAMPIIDADGKLVGGLGLGVSLKMQNRLVDAAHQIASSSEELIAVTQEMASSATELTNVVERISEVQNRVLEEAAKTDEILKMISQIANTSKMLGLNAAIEAARAGEAGRGFNVVAEEIRKLADNSTRSVKEVRDILSAISTDVNQASERVANTVEFAERQAAMAQEISATVQDFAKNTSLVEEVARII